MDSTDLDRPKDSLESTTQDKALVVMGLMDGFKLSTTYMKKAFDCISMAHSRVVKVMNVTMMSYRDMYEVL